MLPTHGIKHQVFRCFELLFSWLSRRFVFSKCFAVYFTAVFCLSRCEILASCLNVAKLAIFSVCLLLISSAQVAIASPWPTTRSANTRAAQVRALYVVFNRLNSEPDADQQPEKKAHHVDVPDVKQSKKYLSTDPRLPLSEATKTAAGLS